MPESHPRGLPALGGAQEQSVRVQRCLHQSRRRGFPPLPTEAPVAVVAVVAQVAAVLGVAESEVPVEELAEGLAEAVLVGVARAVAQVAEAAVLAVVRVVEAAVLAGVAQVAEAEVPVVVAVVVEEAATESVMRQYGVSS